MMQHGFDIEKLREDAHLRWLKPSEVFYILQKHEEFGITQVTPRQPPSGSLLLFNKRVNRFFRNDGHSWQRRNDGKCIAEAHEHLKVENVDALNCYYAHGEANSFFQRRCYWMLKSEFSHIVLVHYREISEGRCIYKPNIFPCAYTVEQDNVINASGKNSLWQFDSDAKSGISNGFSEGVSSSSHAPRTHCELVKEAVISGSEFFQLSPSSKPSDSGGIAKQSFQSLDPNFFMMLQHSQESLQECGYNSDGEIHVGDDIELVKPETTGMNMPVPPSYCPDRCQIVNVEPFDLATFLSQQIGHNKVNGIDNFGQTVNSGVPYGGNFECQPDNHSKMPWVSVSNEPPDSDFSFLQHEDTSNTKNAATSFFENSGELLIREVFPEQAFYSKATKVIIIGDFPALPFYHPLQAVFGDTEVPLQIIQDGVLCCQAPGLLPGKVKLFVTSNNKQSCSNTKDFEYLPDPESTFKHNSSTMTTISGEPELLVRLCRVLLSGSNSASLGDSKSRTSSIEVAEYEYWEKVLDAVAKGNESLSESMTWVFKKLVKDKLQHWLLSKKQAKEESNCFLSKEEKCVLHLISGLGFEWALGSLLGLDITIDFRDSCGWTALHWAARFGREEMVAALLSAGASAGALTDPTAKDPVGKNPATLAHSSGHKGLAGYLSEMALSSHLSSLTIEETENSRVYAASEAEKAVQFVLHEPAQIYIDTTEDPHSLSTSLEAVRNAALTAARILAAFRSLSFKMRQEKAAEKRDEYGLNAEEYHHLSAMQNQKQWKTSCETEDQKFHEAALHIQKKFRGRKGRKCFLTLRHNVIKIQAHVRGYQVRKKYKELLRCVNIIDKIILRWRRGRLGLRGFHVKSKQTDEDEEDDILKAFRKQKVDAALCKDFHRVVSMVGSADARQQYNRVADRVRQVQTEDNIQKDIFDEDLLRFLPPLSPSYLHFPSELGTSFDQGATSTNSGNWFMDDFIDHL